jgi:hypothetical protein
MIKLDAFSFYKNVKICLANSKNESSNLFEKIFFDFIRFIFPNSYLIIQDIR